jgi:hypothetical protein
MTEYVNRSGLTAASDVLAVGKLNTLGGANQNCRMLLESGVYVRNKLLDIKYTLGKI